MRASLFCAVFHISVYRDPSRWGDRKGRPYACISNSPINSNLKYKKAAGGGSLRRKQRGSMKN